MKKAYLGVIFIVVLLLAACGASGETTKKASDEKQASKKAVLTIKDMAGRTVAFEKKPKRIVALTNSDMNILYALGTTVVGRQTQDASGVEADALKKVAEVGNTHDLNLEKIAATAPDAIVASSEQNLKDVPALESLGAKVILTGANSVADIKKQTEILGELVGQPKKAEKLNAEITQNEKNAEQKAPQNKVRALLVLGAPGSNYAALPTSLSGDVLEKAGGINVAKDFKGVENFPQYAALNVEKIVSTDPEIIFLMIHGGDEKETEEAFKKEMKQNQAWNSTSAVKNDQIVVLPADLFGTNPGLRIDEALALMTDKLNQVRK
ncbi:ABC transporter substrate-binding protein [Listeria kieliensis]